VLRGKADITLGVRTLLILQVNGARPDAERKAGEPLLATG